MLVAVHDGNYRDEKINDDDNYDDDYFKIFVFIIIIFSYLGMGDMINWIIKIFLIKLKIDFFTSSVL